MQCLASRNMQISGYNPKQVENLILDAKNIAVVPSKISRADAFCAGAGLYLMLCEKEKDVQLVYPGKIPEGCENIIPKDQILSDITKRELVVSIDYSGISGARAHYLTEDEKLSIKLGPVSNDFPLSRVKAEVRGFNFDLIFVLGAWELYDLGFVHSELRDEFNKATVVNLDNTSKNKLFGAINVVDPNDESLSVLVFKKSSEWGLAPSKKAAEALLFGISGKTA